MADELAKSLKRLKAEQEVEAGEIKGKQTSKTERERQLIQAANISQFLQEMIELAKQDNDMGNALRVSLKQNFGIREDDIENLHVVISKKQACVQLKGSTNWREGNQTTCKENSWAYMAIICEAEAESSTGTLTFLRRAIDARGSKFADYNREHFGYQQCSTDEFHVGTLALFITCGLEEDYIAITRKNFSLEKHYGGLKKMGMSDWDVLFNGEAPIKAHEAYAKFLGPLE